MSAQGTGHLRVQQGGRLKARKSASLGACSGGIWIVDCQPPQLRKCMQYLLFNSPTLWRCYGGLSRQMQRDLPSILTREAGMTVARAPQARGAMRPGGGQASFWSGGHSKVPQRQCHIEGVGVPYGQGSFMVRSVSSGVRLSEFESWWWLAS